MKKSSDRVLPYDAPTRKEAHKSSGLIAPGSEESGNRGPLRKWDQKDSRRSLDARDLIKGRLALPVPEVAKLLGISSTAIRLMIARGDLPGKKVGGGIERITYIVPTGALIEWLDGRKDQPSTGDAA